MIKSIISDGLPIVAVLCCSSKSAYNEMTNVECYDRARDVRTFPGGKPVVAHPPCRSWSACGLPKPGWAHHKRNLWSMEVLQAWWADGYSKPTWLLFSGISPDDIQIPYRLVDSVGDRRRWQLMSKTQRSATHPAMAKWLVSAARHAIWS